MLARVVARHRPVTHRVSCPVDLAALRAFLLTPAAAERPKDDFGRPRLDQPSLGEQAQSLIDAATRVRDGEGVIEIEYREAAKGAAMRAAGHIQGSRVYATGPDPFACSRRVRAAALARFGLDFDDEASYPRAGAHLIAEGRDAMRLFLAHREVVLAEVGNRFFGGAVPATERRDRAKQLVNMLEMDGTFEAWCDGWGVSPHLLRGLVVDLPGGRRLDVTGLVRVQPARTRALVQARPRAFAFAQQVCAELGGNHPDRTLRSYVMQDREAASREAKVAWAAREGWRVVSYQHDGVHLV